MPFVVTPDNVTLAMLELAQVGPQDFVLDLGSGDGRIVILAARRFGARGLGVEIVPDLVERSRRNAAKAGVAERAKFAEQDLFKTDLSVATVITMYLLQEVNLQLRPALLALQPGTRIVSHDWDMGDWQPDRSVTVDAPDKPVGRDKRSRLHLWVVPARVDGAWCGTGPNHGARLRLAQKLPGLRRHAVGGQHGRNCWPVASTGRACAARAASRPPSTARACGSRQAGDAPLALRRRRVRALRRLVRCRRSATPCSRSWRSAAADRSAANPGSVSR